MGDIFLRLMIWFLLTANFSIVNILIGVIIAFLLPHSPISKTSLKVFCTGMVRIILAIPQAYKEAFQLILQSHTEEEIIKQFVQGQRSPKAIFLDIFLITFTPKTTILKYHGEGWYEIHQLKRRKKW